MSEGIEGLEELKRKYNEISKNLDKLCPKCKYPYREHLGTGLEWLCPIKKGRKDR